MQRLRRVLHRRGRTFPIDALGGRDQVRRGDIPVFRLVRPQHRPPRTRSTSQRLPGVTGSSQARVARRPACAIDWLQGNQDEVIEQARPHGRVLALH